MVIQWYGQSCFKITSGEFVLVVDPFGKEIGLTPPRFRSDVVLVSHTHYDHSNAESIAGEPFVVRGPGEYEVKGVFMEGFETYHDKVKGKERGMNTMYKIEIEGIKILHMGDFGEQAISNDILEEIEDVDILMIPVGGKYTIDGGEAAKIVKQIEPRFVIPMHYKIPGLSVGLDNADQFLKDMGAGKKESQDKLTLKKKDIGEDEKTEVIILKVS